MGKLRCRSQLVRNFDRILSTTYLQVIDFSWATVDYGRRGAIQNIVQDASRTRQVDLWARSAPRAGVRGAR